MSFRWLFRVRIYRLRANSDKTDNVVIRRYAHYRAGTVLTSEEKWQHYSACAKRNGRRVGETRSLHNFSLFYVIVE